VIDFPDPPLDVPATPAEQVAVLGGGCFWCVEGLFELVDGVRDAESGYAGGPAEKANYRAVCDGYSGHTEVVRVRFDSNKLTFGQLLKLFFAVGHDPTQLNRQGADVGKQYRSAVFATDDEQQRVAEAYIAALNATNALGKPVVTKVERLVEFFPAEDYHQDYAANNPDQPYIACSVGPKVKKLAQYFGERMRRPS